MNRNDKGEIVNIELSDGRRLNLEELFQEIEQDNVGGAFIATDANGEKHLYLSRDGDIDEERDCLSLI
ncbi:MAG: DUF3892 domain-containing protein [Syntrophomonas sp.]|uniref:DUF3892 domain-containing protein n=1 Tax=Syntrophomonas sp. TaxID=2053627 RepID=UPI00260AFD33|nr:DUF3892 domain-containing protein [Syntrophomonas sp.]MDD2511283.1 DUF3892 domain-containing protein [Syntrophomonas sp.]MDD4627531.1 DUF3892 domain-containing protein [Syntrophomonas sp.]